MRIACVVWFQTNQAGPWQEGKASAQPEGTHGRASGFRGDWSAAAPQLLRAEVDLSVFDFLAEITMSLFARAEFDPSRITAAKAAA